MGRQSLGLGAALRADWTRLRCDGWGGRPACTSGLPTRGSTFTGAAGQLPRVLGLLADFQDAARSSHGVAGRRVVALHAVPRKPTGMSDRSVATHPEELAAAQETLWPLSPGPLGRKRWRIACSGERADRRMNSYAQWCIASFGGVPPAVGRRRSSSAAPRVLGAARRAPSGSPLGGPRAWESKKGRSQNTKYGATPSPQPTSKGELSDDPFAGLLGRFLAPV